MPTSSWTSTFILLAMLGGYILTNRYVLPHINPNFGDRWVDGLSLVIASLLLGIVLPVVALALRVIPSKTLTWRSALSWLESGLSFGLIISIFIRGLEIGSGHVR